MPSPLLILIVVSVLAVTAIVVPTVIVLVVLKGANQDPTAAPVATPTPTESPTISFGLHAIVLNTTLTTNSYLSLSRNGQLLAVGGTPDTVLVYGAESDPTLPIFGDLNVTQLPYVKGTEVAVDFGTNFAISGDGSTIAVKFRDGLSNNGGAYVEVYFRNVTGDWTLGIRYYELLTGEPSASIDAVISDSGKYVAAGAVDLSSSPSTLYFLSGMRNTTWFDTVLLGPDILPNTEYISGSAFVATNFSVKSAAYSPDELHAVVSTQNSISLVAELSTFNITVNGSVTIWPNRIPAPDSCYFIESKVSNAAHFMYAKYYCTGNYYFLELFENIAGAWNSVYQILPGTGLCLISAIVSPQIDIVSVPTLDGRIRRWVRTGSTWAEGTAWSILHLGVNYTNCAWPISATEDANMYALTVSGEIHIVRNYTTP